MSPEGRASIAAAQKARWAKLRKPVKRSAPSKPTEKQWSKLAKRAARRQGGKKAVAKTVITTASVS